MALPRKLITPVAGQIGPEIAVPHVVSGTLGGYHPPKSEALTPSDCNETLNNSAPVAENAPAAPVHPSIGTAQTASNPVGGQPQEGKIGQPERVSLPEFKVRKDLDPPTFDRGRSLLSELYNSLAEVATAYRDRVLPAAEAGDVAPLFNEVNGVLLDLVSLRWGCQRVTTRTLLAPAPYRGAPVDVESKIVGKVQLETEAQRAAYAMDGFLADLVFLDFLGQAHEDCLAARYLAAAEVIRSRWETRLGALDATFRQLADDLVQQRVRWDKACAIDEAGGWEPDKVAAAEKVLAHVTQRMRALYNLLEDYREDLLAMAWPEAQQEGAAA